MEHEVSAPTHLGSCLEFGVESAAFDPELCGMIEVRAEPGRLGVRWSGEKLWTWIEWHGLMVLGRNWPETMKQIIKEQYEQAREEGLEEGLKFAIEEAAKSPEQAKAEHQEWIRKHAIHVLGPTKKPRLPNDDGVA